MSPSDSYEKRIQHDWNVHERHVLNVAEYLAELLGRGRQSSVTKLVDGPKHNPTQLHSALRILHRQQPDSFPERFRPLVVFLIQLLAERNECVLPFHQIEGFDYPECLQPWERAQRKEEEVA